MASNNPSTASEVLELITANLALAVTGCHTAVNHFITSRRDDDHAPVSGCASSP
jgi:hypothetical protein